MTTETGNAATYPEPATEPQVDELTLLKEQATKMGVKFSPNIGVDSLRERVAAALNGTPEPAEAAQEVVEVVQTEAQRKMAVRKRMQEEQMKLVRLRITNLNPSKKDLHGEIFTVGNKYLGDVRKFIPYGEVTDDGFHVPHVLYEQMKERKFLQVKTYTDRSTGQLKVDQRWVAEFALEVLPPLTEKELKQLATNQAAAAGIA